MFMTTKLQDLFLSLFVYNEQTGDLFWLKSGKPAGWIENDYCRLQIAGQFWYAHIVIWVIMTGEYPEKHIDHKDISLPKHGIGNKWSNLRLATNQENMRNRGINNNSSSGFTGVSWNKRQGKWIAHITVDYKTLRIGTYETKGEAIAARQEKEILLFKEYSSLPLC